MKIKAIIFDFDDTLFMTRQTRIAAGIYWAKHFYNRTITKQDILKQWGKPFDEFMKAFLDGEDGLVLAKERYYSILHKFPNRTYEGVPALLKDLSKSYKLGMVSASSLKLILPEFELSDIDTKLFEFIQAQEHTKVHKPDPKVFDPILDSFLKLNINKEEIVYVGDSKVDLKAAKGADLKFIAISGNSETASYWQKQNCHFVKDIRDLPDKIKELEHL